MRLPRRSELSEQQEDFLMEAPFDRPVLCVGPPGTGKTVLALYRAANLSQKREEVNFIMHSKLLNRYAERSVEEMDMDVESTTWNSWVSKLWSRGNRGRWIPEIEKYHPDFMTAIGMINDGMPSKPEEMYWDHLVVDEGQDFPKEFYIFLTFLCHQSKILNGRKSPGVTVFADDNQRMDEMKNSTIRDIENSMPGVKKYSVTVNYRNSGPIAKLASLFCVDMETGVPDLPKNSKGLMPMLRRFQTLDEEAASVIHWLHNNDDLSVGVIVPDTTIQRKFVEALQSPAKDKGFKIQKYSSGDDARKIDFYKNGTITVVCDKSCKGLEFDAVFIPQLQSYKTDGANEDFFKMKMYVMISRARSYLQLSFSDCDEAPQVLKMLPAEDKGILKWKI